ncbi:MAG: DNA-3-methyladenine glycosylase I [Anaerolineae bacterium]
MVGPVSRCFWVNDNPLMIAYHDEEWGVPEHDDRRLFEFFLLDMFQAGLSWELMLNKRENFRRAFDNFEPEKIARYTEEDVARLLADAGIVRNRLKVPAAIHNAQRVLEIQAEFGSFDRYLWQFTGYRTLRDPRGVARETMPTTSPESDAMARDMKRRGFKFVGTTTCYAFMQGIGLVDDHTVDCFRYRGGGPG